MSNSKKIFITGASDGIGEATALELARHNNYTLILTARRHDKLQALRDRIINQYPQVVVHCLTFDVSDFSAKSYKFIVLRLM